MENTSYISQIAYRIEVWLYGGFTMGEIHIEITELQDSGKFPPNLVLIDAYLDDRFGNSGCAFLDTVTGETIVGFAGTNLDNGLGEALKDMAANAKIGVAGGHTANSQYMRQANEFIKRLEANGYHLKQTTGHSLGGNLAAIAAINHDISNAVTYNAAPLHVIGLSSYSVLKMLINKKQVRKYNGRITQFVSDRDWLNNLSDLLGGYYVGEKYLLYNGRGHDMKYFFGSDEQAYIRRVLLMEKGYLEGRIGFALDFNRNGTVDLLLLSEMLDPINLLMMPDGGNRLAQKVKLTPESLEALGFNLMKMNVDELGWLMQAIKECTNKNDEISRNLEPRQETLIEYIVDGLNDSSLKQLLHGINESIGKLKIQTKVLDVLTNFNSYDVTRNFDEWGGSGGRTWYADGQRWNNKEFISAVRSLQNSSLSLLNQVQSTDNFVFTGSAGKTIYTYDTLSLIGEAFVKATNSLEPRIRKVFTGMGSRECLQDGICGAIKEVLLVEEQNVNELQNSVSNLSQIAHGVSQNFAEMDMWIKSFMGNAVGDGGFESQVVPDTYEAYLEESHILDDVKDVLEAYNSQVNGRCEELAKQISGCYEDVLARFHEKYNLIVKSMEEFRSSVNNLSDWMEKSITSERTVSVILGPSQNYAMETKEVKDSHGRLSSYFPRNVVDSINDAKRKILPLLDVFDETIMLANVFGSRLYDLCGYLKVWVEFSVYKSMDLDAIVIAQNGMEQMLTKLTSELNNLCEQIDDDSEGKALVGFTNQVINVMKLMEHIGEMIKDCFGSKI